MLRLRDGRSAPVCSRIPLIQSRYAPQCVFCKSHSIVPRIAIWPSRSPLTCRSARCLGFDAPCVSAPTFGVQRYANSSMLGDDYSKVQIASAIGVHVASLMWKINWNTDIETGRFDHVVALRRSENRWRTADKTICNGCAL